MGRFFHKPAYSIYAQPSPFRSCFDFRTVRSIDPIPRLQRCELQDYISPHVTKSSSLGKQLQSSSKMRFLHKRKAFKKKKTKKMLVNKRKATTT